MHLKSYDKITLENNKMFLHVKLGFSEIKVNVTNVFKLGHEVAEFRITKKETKETVLLSDFS